MTYCPECSSEVARDALSCPRCLRLTHGPELQKLAAEAQAAWRVGNFAGERRL
jgi:hypothetical protein